MTYERRIFNYRHSRARRCIECAFGVLAAKWRFLQTTIETKVETAEKMVLAAVALHNAIICLEGIGNAEAVTEEWNDTKTRAETAIDSQRKNVTGRHSQHATWIRNQLIHYFAGPGKVSWQDDYV